MTQTDDSERYLPPYRPKFRQLLSPVATTIRDDYARLSAKHLDDILEELLELLDAGAFEGPLASTDELKGWRDDFLKADTVDHTTIARYLGHLTAQCHLDFLGMLHELLNQTCEDHANQYFTPPAVADALPVFATTSQRHFQVCVDGDDRAGQTALGNFDAPATKRDPPSSSTPDGTTVIFEPACGSGRCLLAGARVARRVDTQPVAIGVELSRRFAKATAISLALAGVPGWVIGGDALCLRPQEVYKITPGDPSIHREAVPTDEQDILSLPDWKTGSESLSIDLADALKTEQEATAELETVQALLDAGVDQTLGNPPFDTVSTESETVYETAGVEYSEYDLFHSDPPYGSLKSSQATEWLFTELAVRATSPAGAVSYVLPESIQANPKDKPERKWLMEKGSYIDSNLSLPRATFEPATGTKTSAMTLSPRRDSAQGMEPDYEIFMGMVETVGVDSQAQEVILRDDDGNRVTAQPENLPGWYRLLCDILEKTDVVIPESELGWAVREHLDHREDTAESSADAETAGIDRSEAEG